ncbi:hypothetical protein V492_06966 [Pseudogymnoascus sp. VKM F-4246]|nr:hypothetical protein V492_06966 [Pseudogymnoascus sp. VKM F-4246]
MSAATQYVCTRCTRHLRRIEFNPRGSLRGAQISTRRQYSVQNATPNGRPFRMAVIGSGPAGFYTSYKVLSKIENGTVDMYEHLPVPYGLVRFGVAPDHPEVKNCEDKFQEVAESPNFNFIGNISIGPDAGSLPLEAIAPHYDAVLFAYGASQDRKLGIKGEDTVNGIYSARAFVGWYNGLPEYSDLMPDLTMGEEAVVIGQGNVALDVARILLSDVNSLKGTDITEQAIDALSRSRVKSVRVVGRRGPMQAAFTIKEVRELMKLPDVAFRPIPPAQLPPDMSKLPRAPKRIMQVLAKGSEASLEKVPRSWSLDFQLSPTSFNPDPSNNLASLSFDKTSLGLEPFDPKARVTSTGEQADLSAQLAFRSIGYKSEAIAGLSELGVPFDNRLGIIPNDQEGRVLNLEWEKGVKQHVPGMYAAGWVKRGPTGVIASTMSDAFLTADRIAEDWYGKVPFNGGEEAKTGWEAVKVEAEKRGCRRVSWEDWKKIGAAEVARGQKVGKKREKFTTIKEMLRVLD